MWRIAPARETTEYGERPAQSQFVCRYERALAYPIKALDL